MVEAPHAHLPLAALFALSFTDTVALTQSPHCNFVLVYDRSERSNVGENLKTQK